MARAIRSGDFNTYSRLANKRDVDRAERGYPQASGSIREAIQSGNFELYEKLANKKDAERHKYGR